MKINCETSVFREACLKVQRAAAPKSTIPSVEGILLSALGDEVTLTAFDLDMGIITSITCRVEEQGAIILNAKVFCEIIKKIPSDTLCIETDERNITIIRGGVTEFSIIGIDGYQFPELPRVSGGYSVPLDKDILVSMIRQTVYAAAVTDMKVVHTGVKFEITQNKIKLIAVDGSRLAIREEDISYEGEDLGFVVPAKTLKELCMLLDESDEDKVSLEVGMKHIVVDIGDYTIISRLLEGEFLNYRNAIPATAKATAVVEVSEMEKAIEAASTIITDKFKVPLRIVFDDNRGKISGISALGTGYDEFSCEYNGSRLEIGFNNRYLLDALRYSETDKVRLELNGPAAPMLMLPMEGNAFTYLILPMRIKKE